MEFDRKFIDRLVDVRGNEDRALGNIAERRYLLFDSVIDFT